MFWQFVHKWHRKVGIVTALFVVLLSISGIMLNHTETLGMDDQFIRNKLLLNLYDIRPKQEPRGFQVNGHWLTQLGERVYFDDKQLIENINNLIGVITANEYMVIAVDEQLLMLTNDGELIERLTGLDGVPAGMQEIGQTKAGEVVVRAAHGDYLANLDELNWQEEKQVEAAWSKRSPVPDGLLQELLTLYRGQGLSLERVILDLHSGRLFGSWGVYLMDAAAILFFILALSGSWMWFVSLRVRKSNK